MTCNDIQPLLTSFIEDDLPDAERREMSRHLDECPSCRGIARDLERIRSTARTLGPMTPPDHVWLEVAGQLRQRAATIEVRPGARSTPSRAVWQWAGLAAALVVVTLAVYFVTRAPAPESTSAGTPGGNAATQATVEGIADELKLAMQNYENAIRQLEVLANAERGTLDPALAATLQKNLAIVDQAIAESRTALAGNPESGPARESLFEALRRKVGVLQATVSLINEMRQGNQAGAAAIASGRKS